MKWKMNELQNSIWENKYRFENETFDEWLDRVSNGDKELREIIENKRFLFGGRILANRGLHKKGKKITYSNCYVLDTDDSIEDIYKTCSDLARTFSYGGGVGLDISKLRPSGAKVNNAANNTTGAVSFMNTFSQVTETIGQSGRRGALMLSIDCTHPELEEFIDIKTDLDKVTKANVSVRITDDFMLAVINDDDWELSFTTIHNEKITKTVKAKKIFEKLAKNNWDYAEPGILFWDRIESYNILSEDEEFKYAGVNPCAEEPLPNGGSCLLGSFNLSEYITDNGFNFELFERDVAIVVKAMNEVLDEGLPLHPLQIQRDTVRDYRQIGIGIMGLADMLIKLELKYDTESALSLCDDIAFSLANNSLKASALLAKEKGSYPKCKKELLIKSDFIQRNIDSETFKLISKYGLRNSQILTSAPTGSLSTMLGISGGIEPIFNTSYTRKTESLHKEGDRYYKVYTPIVKEYMDKHNITDEKYLPDYFVTSQTIDPFKRVDMQSIWQRHIDASISSTVNLPNESTIDLVNKLYLYAWEQGLKGLTIYRDGCKRSGVLTIEDKSEPVELKRGDWKPLAKDTIYFKKSLVIGCGRLKLFIGYSPSEKAIQDLYIKKSGSGGCAKNLETTVIGISAALRLGGSIENVEKAFSGVDACPSFASARAKGIQLSKGSYCGNAILNAVKDFLKENNIEVNQIATNRNEIVKENNPIIIKPSCPECEAEISMVEGCMTCNSCGFSKCS